MPLVFPAIWKRPSEACGRSGANSSTDSAPRRFPTAPRQHPFERIEDGLHIEDLVRQGTTGALLVGKHRGVGLEHQYASIGQDGEIDPRVIEAEAAADRCDDRHRIS